jgi:hypothetical protein
MGRPLAEECENGPLAGGEDAIAHLSTIRIKQSKRFLQTRGTGTWLLSIAPATVFSQGDGT